MYTRGNSLESDFAVFLFVYSKAVFTDDRLSCMKTSVDEITLFSHYYFRILFLPLSQGSQFFPAPGVGDRDDAALQGPLLWSSPDQRRDWLLPQPSLYMETGESTEV